MIPSLPSVGRLGLLSVVVLLVAACDGLVGPEQDFNFEVVREIYFDGETAEELQDFLHSTNVSATAGSGEIALKGEILIPCANAWIRADGGREGNEIALTVSYDREPICDADSPKFEYRAVFPDLPPAEYTVRVKQYLFLVRSGAPGTRLVFEQEVRVD